MMKLRGWSQMILVFLFLGSYISQALADTPPALKVYNNAQYGIEIYYPPDFEATDRRDEYWKFDYVDFRPADKGVTGSIAVIFNGPQTGSSSWMSFFDTPAYASPPPYQSLGKITIGGIEGVHEVMTFGQGEIHNITIHKGDLKIDLTATWGYVSDNPPPTPAPLPDFTKDKKIIMDAFEIITKTVRFTKP